MTFIRLSSAWALLGLVGLCSLTGVTGNGAAFAQSPQSSGQAPGKSSGPAGGVKTSTDDGAMAPVIQWLERANREYQDTVVQQLSVPTGKGGDVTPPKTKELQATPAQSAPAEPSVIQQVQEWLGLGGDKSTTNSERAPSSPPVSVVPQVGSKETVGKGTTEQGELEKRAAEDAVGRQRAARALEVQRAADEQRLIAEAKKTKDAVDQATRERQAIAENARLAEEQRRALGNSVASKEPTVKEPTVKEPTATAEKDAKAAFDAKQAEALARDRVKAAAELAKTEAAKSDVAKADAAKKAQKAAEAKAPVAPADPNESVRAPNAKPEPKVNRDEAQNGDSQKSDAGRREAPTVTAQDTAKIKAKSDNEVRDAERLAAAANRAGSSAMEKLASPRKGHKTTVVGAATPSREAKNRRRDGRKCQGAGDEVDPPATYVVKQGDTLWSISRRHYEKGHRFEKIVRANDRKIDDPDLIFPCQKLMLPG
jgi:colicin import membrane protein